MDFDTTLLPPGYTAVVKANESQKNHCFLEILNDEDARFDTSYSISMTQKPETLQVALQEAFKTLAEKASRYVTNKHILGL